MVLSFVCSEVFNSYNSAKPHYLMGTCTSQKQIKDKERNVVTTSVTFYFFLLQFSLLLNLKDVRGCRCH